MPIKKTMSASQRLVLQTAAWRPDRSVLPFATAVKARGAAQQKLLESLIKAELVEELLVSDDALCWRREPDGHRVGLRITADGLAAVRGQDALEKKPRIPAELSGPNTPLPGPIAGSEPREGLAAVAEVETTPSRERARPGGKLGQVLDAIGASSGVSLAELVALTGWQPHTARAALTGLRKRGFRVQLIERDGRKAYRLTAA